MLFTAHGQTISVRKIQHRDKDFVGIFFPWNPEIIRLVKSLPDRAYSVSLKSWYLPYTIAHYEALLGLFSLDKAEYPFFLLEQTHTGTIAEATAKDDHTGISSREDVEILSFDAEAVNRRFLTRRDEGRYRVVTD